MYRPPKQSVQRKTKCHKYLETVEQEINNIVIWASLQKQSIVVAGDLNMERLGRNEREGKILIDLEEVPHMVSMIIDATRITTNSQTLLT